MRNDSFSFFVGSVSMVVMFMIVGMSSCRPSGSAELGVCSSWVSGELRDPVFFFGIAEVRILGPKLLLV